MHNIVSSFLAIPLARFALSLALFSGVVACGDDDDSEDTFPAAGRGGAAGSGGAGGTPGGRAGSGGSTNEAGEGGLGGEGGEAGGGGGAENPAGIVVGEVSGDTTEGGEQATFTVVLESQPTDDVVLNLESDDLSEGTVDVDSLTFTSDNWDAPQTVTVTGQDDDEEDGPQEYNVVFAPAQSDDSEYEGLEIAAVTLTNLDDDTAGITVSEISGNTTEEGGTASFTVVLNSAPLSDVTLDLESNNTAEGTVAPTSLTFTPENWNAPQEVVVTGVDDAVEDGDVEFGIEFFPAISDDSAYDGLGVDPVSVVNVDDDSAGFTISAISGNTTEEGGTANFTVRLNSAPTANVVLSLSSDDEGEGTVAPASLTFTSENWNAPRTVTVTGVDDAIIDGDQAYLINFSAAASDDENYDGRTPTAVAVTNVDNETAGFTLTPISGDTTEEGGSATFTIRLNSRPSADVSLGLSSSDTSEGTVSPATLTFTPENWNAQHTVTVTGVNDNVADGDQTYAVVFAAATSSDDDYDGRAPENVSVVNVDNETAGFIVTTVDGSTSEAGGQARVTVRLTSQPTANVVLTFASSDASEGVVSGSSTLTFTADSWNGTQDIIIVGQDDAIADGAQSYTLVFQPATSTDPAYSGRQIAPVPLVNVDDETAGFTVTPSSGTTSEAGTQFTFSVVLNTPPLASVTVNLQSSDTTEGTVSPTSLTFTTANWNAPRDVTVTGVDDNLADGDQNYAITFLATTSTDAQYAAVRPSNVAMTNTDVGDSPGITVSAISNNTDEDGRQATFTVVLNSQPFANVAVTYASSDLTEGQVSPATLTFTPANWSAPRTVTVTGQDDDLVDGNQPFSIVFNPTTSTDAAYSGRIPGQITLFNADNDQAGFVVSPASRNTSEDGTQATFTVRLSSQPFASVSVGLASSDTSEGTLSTSTLNFTTLNWAAPQTVTITGQDDAFVDGNQPYSVDFSPAVSADAAYQGIVPTSVNLSNVDNDTAAFRIEAEDTSTSEAGGQATISVSLTSQPSANVTLTFGTSNADEGILDRSSLTFTPENWNAPQVITATGVNDELADGDQPYFVLFAPATSADEDYDGLDPTNVTLTNVDDDTAGIEVTQVGEQTTEAGGSATFTVVLTSEPFSNVTVNFDVNDATEAAVDTDSLVFTAANWDEPQIVTVMGVDDDLADGNQAFTVVFDSTTSADADYAAITPINLGFTNLDDDTAGIQVTLIDATSSEAGDTAAFSVVLTSQPFAPVTVNFASTDETEGTVVANSLTFTTGNWDSPRIVLVTGQDDAVDDGNQPYRIDFGSTTSADAAYAAITPVSLNLSNLDNDTASISAFALNGQNTTTEDGGQALLGVVLNSQPTGDVVLTLNSQDTTEGLLNITTLTFTPQTWNQLQTVLVTGVNDDVVDGTVAYQVQFLTITTSDTNYATLQLPSVTLFNTDND